MKIVKIAVFIQPPFCIILFYHLDIIIYILYFQYFTNFI